MTQAIRIVDISTNENICAQCKVALMALAIEDLAIAQAMFIIHGENWVQKYIDYGGRIRYIEGDDEPWIHFNLDELVIRAHA